MQMYPGQIFVEIFLALLLQVTPLENLDTDTSAVWANDSACRIAVTFVPRGNEGELTLSYFEGEVLAEERIVTAIKGKDNQWILQTIRQPEGQPKDFPVGTKANNFWVRGEKNIDLLPWDRGNTRQTTVIKSGDTYTLVGIPFKISFDVKGKNLHSVYMSLGDGGDNTFTREN